MRQRGLRIVVGLLLVGYCGYLVADLCISRDAYLWDFDAYYHAGQALLRGESPYYTEAGWRPPGQQSKVLVFPYHPIVLAAFAGLSAVGYRAAYLVYLFAHVGVVAAVVWLWRAKFARGPSGVALYLMCLFGFNSALYLGVRAGNINTFELGLLWLAFYAFVRNRPIAFSALVVTASLGKTMPILFLVLLFFFDVRHRWRHVAWAGLMFAGVHGLTYLVAPALSRDYAVQKVHYLSMIDERGLVNPSTLPLVKDVCERLVRQGILPREADASAAVGAYLVIVAAVLVVTWLAARRLRVEGEARRRVLLVFACLVYALILPRFKDYAYSLLIVPACFVIFRQRLVRVPYLLLGILVVPYVWSTLPGVREVAQFLVPYGPLLMAYALWVLLGVTLLTGGQSSVDDRGLS